MSPSGRTAVLLWVLFLAGARGHAQIVGDPNSHSFDTVTDPRSLAMGESSVADAEDPAAAFSSNPANLAFLRGPGLFYSYRSFDGVEKDLGIEDLHAWSLGVASAAPMGGAALSFGRREHGNSRELRVYDQTLALAYAACRGHVAAGGAVGFFNRYALGTDLERESSYVPSFDLGVLYHAGESADGPFGGLSIGMALQNLAPDHTWTITSDGREFDGRMPLPRYLRTGFRYAADRPPAGLFPALRTVFAGEYRWYFNPPEEQFHYESGSGGAGLELTVAHWLCLRAGWIEYHDKGLRNRDGLGINLSPDSGFLPAKVRFDYAPVRLPDGEFYAGSHVHSFGLRLSW